jgi:acyl dehydratase
VPIEGYSLATLGNFTGRELGVSSWITVDQDRINRFADCTGDHQWIHVDVERAKKESPVGAPIAHGFLCLSLIVATYEDVGVLPPDAAQVLNYGLDRVRFMAPVKAGSRVRNRVLLVSATQKDKGVLVKTQNTLEIEGEEKPALVAESLMMFVAS